MPTYQGLACVTDVFSVWRSIGLFLKNGSEYNGRYSIANKLEGSLQGWGQLADCLLLEQKEHRKKRTVPLPVCSTRVPVHYRGHTMEHKNQPAKFHQHFSPLQGTGTFQASFVWQKVSVYSENNETLCDFLKDSLKNLIKYPAATATYLAGDYHSVSGQLFYSK